MDNELSIILRETISKQLDTIARNLRAQAADSPHRTKSCPFVYEEVWETVKEETEVLYRLSRMTEKFNSVAEIPVHIKYEAGIIFEQAGNSIAKGIYSRSEIEHEIKKLKIVAWPYLAPERVDKLDK